MLPSCIIVDIDGTIKRFRGPYNPNTCSDNDIRISVLNVINWSKQNNNNIFIFSGREDIYNIDTIKFLEKHKIQYDKLVLRHTGDYRDDTIIKEEMYNTYVKDKYNVLFWLYVKDKYNVLFWLDDRTRVVNHIAPGDF